MFLRGILFQQSSIAQVSGRNRERHPETESDPEHPRRMISKMDWVGARKVGMIIGVMALAFAGPAVAQGTVPLPPVTPPSGYAAPGIIEVEGGVTLNYRRLDGSSATTFTLSPAVRYFIMNGLAVGVRFELQIIEDGPKSVRVLPQAEYNLNMGRLFPYVGIAAGIDYTKSGGHSSTDFALEPGVGIKLAFGGGLIGLGLQVPVLFGDPVTWGLDVLTRYAIFF
jgi:hypothetical protein